MARVYLGPIVSCYALRNSVQTLQVTGLMSTEPGDPNNGTKQFQILSPRPVFPQVSDLKGFGGTAPEPANVSHLLADFNDSARMLTHSHELGCCASLNSGL